MLWLSKELAALVGQAGPMGGTTRDIDAQS